VSIKKLADGRYQVREVVRDPKTGRRVNRKATVATRREAQDLARQFRDGSASGGRRPRVTLQAYVTSWARARAGTLKPSVRRRYRQALELHILPALGELYIDKITPADVQKYVTDRVAEGAAGNTVLNELRLIRTISRDSVADGMAARHWADRVKPPKVKKYTEEDPNMLTARQLGEFFGALPRHWLRVASLMGTTSARWGEASAIGWEDIEVFADGVPKLKRTPWDVVGEVSIRHSNWRGQLVTVKTDGSYRTVPLVRFVAELLGPPQSSGLVFPTAEGTLHKGWPLRHVFDAAFVKLGWCVWDKSGGAKHQHWKAVPAPGGIRITPHGLRRTWNNLARQRGDRQVVQAVTGHVTDAMTDHYSLIRRDEKAVLASTVARAALAAPEGDEP